LPILEGTIEVTDSEAVGYMQRLTALFPGVATAFGALTTGVSCAIEQGVMTAKVIITEDFTMAVGVVIFSYGQIQQGLQIAAGCFLNEVLGGGDAQFSPCLQKFYYDAVTDGVPDTYYVFIGGTHTSMCDAAAREYSIRFQLTPF